MEKNSFHLRDFMSAFYVHKKVSKNFRVLEIPGTYSVATIHRTEPTNNPQVLDKIFDF